MIATIGYEKTTLESFIQTLVVNEIDVLIDIRDRAQSRKKGFSKTSLSEAIREAGLEYVHFRALGDPKEGREAARAGQYSKFHSIFNKVMNSSVAKEALLEVGNIAEQKRICLMCYEKDHRFCHRKIVSDYSTTKTGIDVIHLEVGESEHQRGTRGSVLYSCESTAT